MVKNFSPVEDVGRLHHSTVDFMVVQCLHKTQAIKQQFQIKSDFNFL